MCHRDRSRTACHGSSARGKTGAPRRDCIAPPGDLIATPSGARRRESPPARTCRAFRTALEIRKRSPTLAQSHDVKSTSLGVLSKSDSKSVLFGRDARHRDPGGADFRDDQGWCPDVDRHAHAKGVDYVRSLSHYLFGAASAALFLFVPLEGLLWRRGVGSGVDHLGRKPASVNPCCTMRSADHMTSTSPLPSAYLRIRFERATQSV